MGPPGESDPGEARGGHRRRRAARRQAIDILFEADLMGRPSPAVVQEWRAAGRGVSEYAEELVVGVSERMADIDERIGSNSEGWAVHRMPVLDRTILRVACYELEAGVPPAVAISEAVQAANELSTGDSGRFVNGVLGGIVRAGDRDDAGEES
jgi:transcription antitermination protein NusB